MGIETERFVDTVPQEALCPVCCLVLREPVRTPCHHHVCLDCSKKWKKCQSSGKCPFCCMPLSGDNFPKSNVVWKLVLNLNVYCMYSKEGCTATYKLGLEETHLKRCPYHNKTEINRKVCGSKTRYVSDVTQDLDSDIESRTHCSSCMCTLETTGDHDCVGVLSDKLKLQTTKILNLEYENDRLSLRVTTKENSILDHLAHIESGFQQDALEYEREIRELRAQVAALQGEVKKRQGKVEEVVYEITLVRRDGSLGFNIVGGHKEKDSTKFISVSRIFNDGAAAGKLQEYDRLLEVNGVNIRNATHEEAVKAIKSASDPVNLLILRDVDKAGETASDVSTQTGPTDEVFDRISEVSLNDSLNEKSEGSLTDNTSDNGRSKLYDCTDSAAVSGSEAEESLTLVLDQHRKALPSDKGDLLYDSAYDTLMTQKSTRTKRPYSCGSSASKDDTPGDENEVSSEDLRTTTPCTVINGYATPSSSCPSGMSSPQLSRSSTNSTGLNNIDERYRVKDIQRDLGDYDALKIDSLTGSPKKFARKCTFYIMDEASSGFHDMSEKDGSSLRCREDSMTSGVMSADNDMEYEYEYEEVSLGKEGGKFGIQLCYGGDDNDLAVYIGEIEEDSVAEKDGHVIVGDQIIKINGAHVRDVDKAYKMLQESDEVTLLLARPSYEDQAQLCEESDANLEEPRLETVKEQAVEEDLILEQNLAKNASSLKSKLVLENNTSIEKVTKDGIDEGTTNETVLEKPSSIVYAEELQRIAQELYIEHLSQNYRRARENDKEGQSDSRPIDVEEFRGNLKDYVLSRLTGEGEKSSRSSSKERRSANSTPRTSRKDYGSDHRSGKQTPRGTPKTPRKEYGSTSSPRHYSKENTSSPVRSALKKDSSSSRSKGKKHVRVDTKHDWTMTEKRVWEEFKLIQQMEAEESKRNPEKVGSEAEAEWKVRRSKDGKHVYIRKQAKENKVRLLRERAQKLTEERTGITTDDDANTMYLGRFWSKEERRRQLMRHRQKCERLRDRINAKNALPVNPMDAVMAEIVQKKMTSPGNTFDDFLTVEEILTQRNRDGYLEGPIHVTTV